MTGEKCATRYEATGFDTTLLATGWFGACVHPNMNGVVSRPRCALIEDDVIFQTSDFNRSVECLKISKSI